MCRSLHHCRLKSGDISISRVPTISPVISPSSGKQVKQSSSSKEQLTATWVDEPWQAQEDVVDAQQTKSSEE